MKRNWDTVREILLAIEILEPEKQLIISDFNEERAHEISYHVQLIEQAGLVNVTISQSNSLKAKDFFARNLTWEGHEFLDSIRVKDTWTKVKNVVSDKGGVMTFEVIKAVAAGLVKTAIA
jgi:hypothetical protein